MPEKDAPPNNEFLDVVRRYTRLLTYYGRYKDAIRIFRAAYELAGDESYNQQGRDMVEFHTGRAMVHCGLLREGLSKVLTSYYRLPEVIRKREHGVMLEAQLYAGNLSFEEADRIGDYNFGSKSTVMLTFAAWNRSPKQIRRVLNAMQSSSEGAETREGLIEWANAAADVLEGRSIPKEFLEEKVDPMPSVDSIHYVPYFEQYGMTAYVAIYAGHLDLAENLCDRACRMEENFNDKRQPQLIVLCSHWKNVLDLTDKLLKPSAEWLERRERAKQSLNALYEKSYGFLRELIEEKL